MKKEIIGIIAEFNPLHNGHKRLIKHVKTKYPDSILIIAMSGNFVQRGELAIYDKWVRSKAAIKHGADLVVELPPYYVLNHANIFAKASVKLLKEFGVNKIIFGTESLEIDEIHFIAKEMIINEDKIESLKKKYHSLPKAFEEFMGSNFKSNDTLGICYIVEANKQGFEFEFERLERVSNEEFTSASKIRESIKKGELNTKSLIKLKSFNDLDEYSDVIIGKILTTESDSNSINYLKNQLTDNGYKLFSELINKSANKNFTKSRLRRDAVRFILELKGSEKYIILASSNLGNDVLRDLNNYEFRHTKDNEDNFKVERFLSIKKNKTIEVELSKNGLKK